MAYSETTYFKLRSRLDAFETMALAYCLNAPNDEEAQTRMEYILKNLPLEALKNNLMEAGRQENFGGGDPLCPTDAPYYCNGECLPYPCPTK